MPDDFSILQNGGGIPQRAPGLFRIPVNVADAERNRADAFRHFCEFGEIGFHKVIAQKQIAWRIAAQKQFRRENKLRTKRDGFFITRDKLPAVGREVADGRIELEDADFQRGKISGNWKFLKSRNARHIKLNKEGRKQGMAFPEFLFSSFEFNLFPRCGWLRRCWRDAVRA